MSTYHIYVPGTKRPVLYARVTCDGHRGRALARVRTRQSAPHKAKNMANWAVHIDGHESAQVWEFKPRRLVYEARKASR